MCKFYHYSISNPTSVQVDILEEMAETANKLQLCTMKILSLIVHPENKGKVERYLNEHMKSTDWHVIESEVCACKGECKRCK